MDAFGLPKGSDEEKAVRSRAIQDATRYAIEVPFRTMKKALECFDIIEAMVDAGNPNSVTDAGVGALCVRSAVIGAYLNVKVNGAGFKDKDYLIALLKEADALVNHAKEREETLLKKVLEKISV